MVRLEASTGGGGARSYAMGFLGGVLVYVFFVMGVFCVFYLFPSRVLFVCSAGACLHDDGFSFQGKVKPIADGVWLGCPCNLVCWSDRTL